MTACDATHILQVSRSSGAVSANSNSSSDVDVEQSELELIKSDVVFALLLSVYQSAGELRRILRQEWVRGWDGWDEVVIRCDRASSVEEKHTIAEECLIRLARISMDNVHERFMSDIDMQRQLLCGNLHIGKSEQLGRNNACLADSLLQLLM